MTLFAASKIWRGRKCHKKSFIKLASLREKFTHEPAFLYQSRSLLRIFDELTLSCARAQGKHVSINHEKVGWLVGRLF